MLKTHLQNLGLSDQEALHITKVVAEFLEKYPKEIAWKKILTEILVSQKNFSLHKLLYEAIYPDWQKIPEPSYIPDASFIRTTHLSQLMQHTGFKNFEELHAWSTTHFKAFWKYVVQILSIVFDKPYTEIVDLSRGPMHPLWFLGSKINIAKSCFNAPEEAIAIISQAENGHLKKLTYGELQKLSNRVANSLKTRIKKGDNVAIVMPMNTESVIIYLGIIKAGAVVISIAESFAANEIAARLKIANTQLVFTQDLIIRDGKELPLYEKVLAANAPQAIVLNARDNIAHPLRSQDIAWQDFLSSEEIFSPIACEPNDYINILFSSGTTGTPKAIPWTHTTPIKSASDAYFHQNIEPHDVFCWPTSLGWMMGPWLIFATLINKGTIALYEGSPNTKAFGKFVEEAKVNLLGVVPTLIKAWRTSACMEGLDWSSIKNISSTGECSNIEDMLYLMFLCHYKPIIEYCGGTEIGGAYITNTVIQNLAPSAFSTAAMGIDFVILNEKGLPAKRGEVALIPPSIGLSTELFNKNHDEIYYKDMPCLNDKILRRHSDGIEQFANGFYRLHGRMDDTMKLGGIKTSAVEIEEVLNKIPDILETAVIAIQPKEGGPSSLVVYATLKNKGTSVEALKTMMQKAIKQNLNPLFKIYDVVIVDALPKTASNKIMRRVLKDEYHKI